MEEVMWGQRCCHPARYCLSLGVTTLTLTVDDEDALRARQIAQRRHTSLEEMLQSFVANLGRDENGELALAQRQSAAQKLLATFQDLSRPLGGKGYATRDELYER
jgi:hypothetical protein